MNTKLLFCISLVLSMASSGFAESDDTPDAPPPTVKTFENRKVGKIEVKIENLPEGALFDKQTVLAKLRTHEEDPFYQHIFDQDLKQLAEEYDRVEPKLSIEGDSVDITLHVWLRPIIRSIEWEGNEHVTTRTLRKELDIQAGTVFNRSNFNKAFNKVKEYYTKKGYFESELTYKLIPDPKTGEVDVVIHISEGRAGKVDNIVFHGFSSEEESDILDKLYTKKYSALTSWFTGRGRFVEEALEQDRLSIFNYLQDHGYADARVDIKILESKTNGRIILDITAEKGVLYHFGQISFDGNVLFTNEEVEKMFLVHPGGIYSPEKLRLTIEKLKELYGRKGYIDTSVTYETQLVENAPIYNVHFHVEEGKEFRIGMIRIIGNVQTEARVILRESLLIPGETFDSLRLKVTQVRLENMGYFKSVNVYAVRTQDDLALGDNYRDIYIEVTEKQTGNISLFSGFSSADSVFGGLDLTERNFNYKGLPYVFKDGISSIRGGGEFLHMRAQFGSKQQSYLLSWMNPYFLDSLWRIGFEFVATLNSKLQSEAADISTYNFGTFFNYPLSPYLTYGVKYRVRNYQNSVDFVDEKLDKQLDKHGILSGLGTSLSYDSTDRAIKPHRGLRSVLEGELAGLGGNAFFFRSGYINSFFTPLWNHGYMRYRWEFRFILPYGPMDDFKKVPISERFFLGGVASVRGYKDFILGPRKEDNDGHQAPLGGISSSLLSLEYVQEILPFLDTFLFIDGGYVSENKFSFKKYQMSYGIGLNVDVLGRIPITVGWGFPVNAEKGQTRHFFFSLGGQF